MRAAKGQSHGEGTLDPLWKPTDVVSLGQQRMQLSR